MDMEEFMKKVLSVLPNAVIGYDNDKQLIIYSGYQLLTDEDNPSIPAGEHIIQPIANNNSTF